MKLVSKVRVKNRLGLHARPAAVIARLLQECQSDVSLTHQKRTINARSIMSILVLAAKKNAQITITVEGVDAEETLQKLIDLFENQFDET